MKYEVTINNYQKGAQLKTAMPDHVILLEKIDRNHHWVVYELESERLPLTEGIMLYCAEGDREAVIFADELTSDQQVVVKPLSILLNKYDLKRKGIAGCSILADGSITLITDINELLKYNGVKSRAELG